MPTLSVFNHTSLDGYFTDAHGDMRFAHAGKDDPEWNAFVGDNTAGGGTMVFGRITYEMMASFWPTPLATQTMPLVAERMNARAKIVFSRTLERAEWRNTTLVRTDPIETLRRLKVEGNADLVILGSGSLVAQLAPAGVIDEYQIAINPIVLGAGRSLFDGMPARLPLRLVSSRTFRNGTVVVRYVPAD